MFFFLFIYIQAAIIGTLCLVQSSPVKVSRPQAITAANLTQQQVASLIQENPPRPSILQPSDQFLPPSLPLYLPDPERNKSKDDFYLLTTYHRDGDKSDEHPVQLPLTLDTFIRPPPLPSLDSSPINFQVAQAEKDKSSYSYNDRYDYYFPVKVVYDDKRKFGEQELQLMEMQPPVQSDEPNYYETKPKKVPKKYQPNKKDVNHSKSNGRDDDDALVPIDNDGLVLDSEHTPFVTSQPVERFAPAPSYRDLIDDDLNTGEFIPKYRFEENTEAISLPVNTASSTIASTASEKVEQKLQQTGESNERKRRNWYASGDDQDGDDNEMGGTRDVSFNNGNKRIEFQMHGFEGPNSYKFGYDTGLG